MTEAIGAITSGVTTDFQKKDGKDLEKIQNLKENNPFSKFDINGDGKIAGTEIAALKVVLAGMSFDTDDEGAIDEAAFNAAFSDAEYTAK